jgi:hypothetical protein
VAAWAARAARATRAARAARAAVLCAVDRASGPQPSQLVDLAPTLALAVAATAIDSINHAVG